MIKFNRTLFCILALVSAVQAETLRVQIQNGQVRSKPSFLGEVVANVAYGQSVEVLSVQNVWQQVRTGEGKTGWLHTSALTAKRIGVPTGGGSVRSTASSDEIALAGKGFNSKVEAEFKAAHAEIDFAWVDKMEGMNASTAQINAFAKVGGLKPEGDIQ
jgi:uncharacterized protein YgiM (DUF1202 family)